MSVALRRELKTKLEVEAYWDHSLTPSKENPFPLAPPDKVKEGLVSVLSYQKQNLLLAEKSLQVMVPELIEITKSRGFEKGPRGIEVLGAGLMRDLGWLTSTPATQFSVSIRDCSSVACEHAETFVKKHRISAKVHKMEVEEGWKSGQIDDRGTILYYAGQFIQNQYYEAVCRILEHLGRFLATETEDGVLRRKVYFLHPRGEDNPTDRVQWKNTTPYWDIELRASLEKGFGGKVLMETIGKHDHFHQRYTFFRISAP